MLYIFDKASKRGFSAHKMLCNFIYLYGLISQQFCQDEYAVYIITSTFLDKSPMSVYIKIFEQYFIVAQSLINFRIDFCCGCWQMINCKSYLFHQRSLSLTDKFAHCLTDNPPMRRHQYAKLSCSQSHHENRYNPAMSQLSFKWIYSLFQKLSVNNNEAL